MQSNFRFLFFWPKFDSENNFFVDTFQSILNESKLGFEFDLAQLEIEFHSVFGWPRKLNPIKRALCLWLVKFKRVFLRKTIILIWYSGELGRLPKGYDMTLSYSPTLGNNVYLPVWAIYTTNNESLKKYDRDFIFSWNEILNPREVQSFENKLLACTFISNPSKERLKFARELERLGALDIYGAAVGKPIESKFEVSRNYIFQLCLENQDVDNYVTEKPFEAWISGNIPIYRKNGSLSPLNDKSYIDVSGFAADQLIDELAKVVSDERVLNNLYCEPILKEKLDMIALEKLFVQTLEKVQRENRK